MLRSAVYSKTPQTFFGSSGRRLRGQCARSTAPWRAAVTLKDGFLTREPSSATLDSKSILLCGEGDFSFARALVSLSSAETTLRVTATSYEPVDDIGRLWGGAENLRALRDVPGVELLHGIDATALDARFEGREWDRVCFMFPHIAGKGRISLNRELLAGFFRAVSHVLAPGGAVEVALVAGQGGTATDGDAQREYGNTWQAASQAAEGGLVLVDTAPFDAAAWEARGYRSRGHWRGLTQERGFQVRDGVVHLFRREGELDGAICPEPVTYYRDVSFWVSNPDCFSEATLHDVVQDTAGCGVDATCSTLEEYVHEDGRVSRTIRVAYSSRVLAYSKQRANASQFALRDAFEAGWVPGSELR